MQGWKCFLVVFTYLQFSVLVKIRKSSNFFFSPSKVSHSLKIYDLVKLTVRWLLRFSRTSRKFKNMMNPIKTQWRLFSMSPYFVLFLIGIKAEILWCWSLCIGCTGKSCVRCRRIHLVFLWHYIMILTCLFVYTASNFWTLWKRFAGIPCLSELTLRGRNMPVPLEGLE